MPSPDYDLMYTFLAYESPHLPPNECSNCKKSNLPLRHCSRCREATYCSTDCQKSHWKSSHKGDRCIFAAIRNNCFLDSLKTEKEVYAYLIDAYRMRVEDDYKFGDGNRGLHAQEHPLADFRKYLNRAEKILRMDRKREAARIARLEGEGKSDREDVKDGPEKIGILPMWWDDEKRRECEDVAMDEEEWSAITFAVEKHDIQEHYGDDLMPIKLGILAEFVYNRGVTLAGDRA